MWPVNAFTVYSVSDYYRFTFSVCVSPKFGGLARHAFGYFEKRSTLKLMLFADTGYAIISNDGVAPNVILVRCELALCVLFVQKLYFL
ncbi:hypothetical protein QE152_g14437 [Popillia japonica]|uniref:Uncharacterized protein n=1 Tax=Popillia japonica TaxID=7064 RepID=A0AAW1L6Q1_POPJA